MNFIGLCFFSSLAAIALSKTLDYYADVETSEMTPSLNESVGDEDGAESETDGEKNRKLYDKVGKVTKRRNGPNNNAQDGDEEPDIVSGNVKTIVVICSK